jgi:hypothetical protein
MEAMLRISLHSYLYLKLAKTLSFLLFFYVFSSTKLDARGRNRFCPEEGVERGAKQCIHI